MTAFAVVVVNFRSADLAVRCLRAAAQEGPAELVAVDNASGDGSATALRAEPGVTVIERAVNDGFAAGVNAGFAATRSPVVILLNPDALPRPGALGRLVATLDATPAAGVAAPRLFNEDGTVQPSAYRRAPGLGTLFAELCLPLAVAGDLVPALNRYRLPDAAWRPGATAAHAIGAALAIRRAAFDAAGPLDDGYFLYLEETEWQARVRAAGFTVALAPDAEVDHLVRGGGDGALAPSVHFLASARRYLLARGHRRATVTATLTTALALSRLGARAWDRFPGATHTGGRRVAAWDALWANRA